jgi:phosphatidylglycerol lysyltransferase
MTVTSHAVLEPAGRVTGPGPGAAVARWAPPLVATAVLALLAVAGQHELRAYRLHAVLHDLTSLSAGRVLAALALTVTGHLVHVGYDLLALRYAEQPLPVRRIAFGSLVTYSVSAVTGFTGMVGASLRYRFWSWWGVPPARIAEAVGFATLTAGLGAAGAAGAAAVLDPAALSRPLHLSPGALRLVGVALLLVVAGYLLACALVRRPLRVRGVPVRLPGPSLGAAQVVVATLDWAIAGSVFFVLLPAHDLSLAGFLTLFLVAQTGGIVAHLPAGLGVFDAGMLVLLRPFVTPATAVASLVAYRAIAYVLPALAAGVSLAGWEIGLRREPLLHALRRSRRWLAALVPSTLSGATILAGSVLLASGATPGVPTRLAWLAGIVPLGVIEAAHFAGSLAGVGLLLLARGLHRRLDAAYHLTVLALAVGISASLLKGGDFEEALVLGGVLALVAPARGRFYRRAALLSGPWSPGWLAAVALALAGTVWLGLFSYRHVGYSHDLWWRFALDADAPRWLRAEVGVAVLLAVAGLTYLLGPSHGGGPAPGEEQMERAAHLARETGELRLYLALLGDKSLLFGPRGGALMYAVSGRSWIAMGDPVGPPEERRELAWRLKELADRHAGWPVFYEVGRQNLPLYVDLGSTLVKIGEEGRVPLAAWSLDGSARARQRRTVRAVERANCRFEIVAPEDVPPLLPELRLVSDAWLAAKHTREKRFSLGFFDERYLRHFPVAVVRNERGIQAFANLWLSGSREEFTLDLMRYHPGAPRGIMEYVLTRLILWGRNEGYAWFNLGMAPLSGLESRALAPLWSRFGALAFRHGEHFYNFRGLREYKAQFGPVWEPRYLAVPSRLALPRVLSNLATLVSGSLAGAVAK